MALELEMLAFEKIPNTAAAARQERAAIQARLPIPAGTRLAAGDRQFLYRFVTQYEQRFAGRCLRFDYPDGPRFTGFYDRFGAVGAEPPLPRPAGTAERHRLQFDERYVLVRETQEVLRDGVVVETPVDLWYRDAAAVLQLFKDYTLQGMLREYEDLTDLLVFPADSRW